MCNVGSAFEGLFYSFITAIVAAVFLSIYVIWQTFFGFTPWEICGKMETDTAKVQCMETYYE